MSSVLTSAPVLPFDGPRLHRWTREEYHRLAEQHFLDGKRTELIRGEIVEMSPRNWPHVVACRKCRDILEQVFQSIGWVSHQEPLNLIESEPEPDVAVLPGRFEDYNDHPTNAILVVEVAQSSLHYDLTTKAKLYAEKWIPEYLVVDLEHNQLVVFRDPGATTTANAEYQSRQTFTTGQTITPIHAPSATISIAGLFPESHVR